MERVKSVIDYDVYVMPFRDKVIYIAAASVCIFFVTFIFYHNMIISLILCPLAFLYPRFKTSEIVSRRKNELNMQFKDMLYALSSSLFAGRSVELAFEDVLKDLSIIYPNSDTYIIIELNCIIRKIEMNETVESALADFADRSHLEDIDNFVDVFYTCKRAGGNLIEVIKNTSNIITDKIEIRQEIDVMLAQRKLEHKILNILPVIMILLLSTSAEDYMRPVFSELLGRVAMTISLILLGSAFFVSKRIMDIKV